MLKEVGRIASGLRAILLAISLAAIFATAINPQPAAAQGAVSPTEAHATDGQQREVAPRRDIDTH